MRHPEQLFLMRPSVHRSLLLVTFMITAKAQSVAQVNFSREILPILSSNCFHCHGPDAAKRKAELRLDTPEGLHGAGRSGALAVVPGNSAGSELILRITSPHEDDAMPPPTAPQKLKPAQVEILRRWIDQGAPWDRHWSFTTIGRPEVPNAKDIVSHPIDCFIRNRLEHERLEPSKEADRRTLLRRLSLDLLGLPPDPEMLRAFEQDRRPDAYERVVDTLLASPHFGERWGRHWLDLARYADSAGYLNDTLRPYAYLYRDWVIDSFNRDQPFDQFTIEQLAGDLLPQATLEQKIATGFHRNSLKNDEAGADLELDRTKAAADRTATTGAVWLGLTVGCAECHTHKYDPISHREFYQLYAFFNSTAEREVHAPRPDELATYERKLEVWEQERMRLEDPLAAYIATLAETRLPAWEAGLRLPAERWSVLRPDEITTITEDEERAAPPSEDLSFSTGVKDPLRTRYVIRARVNLKGVTGLRLEALAELGEKTGRSRGGDFSLGEFSATLKTAVGEQHKLEFTTAKADFEAKSGPAAHALDGDNTTGWSVSGETDRSHVIVFELRTPQDFPEGSTLLVELEHRLVGVISRFRLAATLGAAPLTASPLPDQLVAILDQPATSRTTTQQLALARHMARFADEGGQAIFAAIAAHHSQKPEYPKTAAPVLAHHERQTRIHTRGDYLQPGEEVSAGTPNVLHPLRSRSATANRLDLARWLVDPANPLTPRVTVNHIWKHLFGRGLVATADNFGALGEPPSHPELLDYLATEFLRVGWSRKQLIRFIVTSATYRQSSDGREDLLERDPFNTLLARQGRHRLEAETVRDVFLASSGLLNPRIGGPSIYPPLPAFVLAFGRNRSWPESTGPERYRRGMYIHLRRNVPYPMLTTFDASDASVACIQRERSNSPLQALTLLNDPVFFECSEKLGERLNAVPGDLDAKLRHGFELCLGRLPQPAELQSMRSHHDDQLRVAGGDTRRAMVAAARLILNLDEFITRE